MSRPDPPEFDRYAESYRDLHAKSIQGSGDDLDYFARYKIEEVARVAAHRDTSALRVLDFGCGIGTSTPDFRRLFPEAELTGVDVSAQSVDMARERLGEIARFDTFDGVRLPYQDGSFDLAFTSCVFHHIAPDKRAALIREVRRVLDRNGEFFFFEHNPWNPLTVKVVRDCPFDENAILLNASEAVSLIRSADFRSARTRYTVFFPKALARLRPLERFLNKLPVGGQYFVHARV